MAKKLASEPSPISARLFKAKNDDHIRAAYSVPHGERLAHVLLGYEPTYTSYLQKRKKKTKEQLEAERAETSRKRKRVSFKGKSVEAVELSSDTKVDLHRARIQDLAGSIREPLPEEFEEDEEEEDMGGDLGELPSLIKKPRKSATPSAKGTSTLAKRAPVNTETDTAELKKQRLVLGSGSGKDMVKSKTVAGKTLQEKTPTEKDSTAETSSPIPFIFAPQTKLGQPVLLTDSVRANPRLGLPVLQGVCLPEDMKQVPADLEGNIVDLFSHLTLANQSLLCYHQKVVNLSSSFSSLKIKYKDALIKKRDSENELAAARLQLSEMDEAKKQLSELETLKGQVKELQQKLSEEEQRSKEAVSVAHSAGFQEAKEKVIAHYQGQVEEITNMGFRRGAKIYYFKGVAKGYELGLEAGSVPAESALRALPEVETPEIEIPPEEEVEEDEEAAETEVGEDPNTVAEAENNELGKDA